jgi:hypothetical protein
MMLGPTMTRPPATLPAVSTTAPAAAATVSVTCPEMPSESAA